MSEELKEAWGIISKECGVNHEYAFLIHYNIFRTIFNAIELDRDAAHRVAASLIKHLFNYDITGSYLYKQACSDGDDTLDSVVKKIRVMNTKLLEAWRTIQRHCCMDFDYAWSIHCNITMPIYDATQISRTRANEVAAIIMRHIFKYDVTGLARYLDIVCSVDELIKSDEPKVGCEIEPGAEPFEEPFNIKSTLDKVIASVRCIDPSVLEKEGIFVKNIPIRRSPVIITNDSCIAPESTQATSVFTVIQPEFKEYTKNISTETVEKCHTGAEPDTSITIDDRFIIKAINPITRKIYDSSNSFVIEVSDEGLPYFLEGYLESCLNINVDKNHIINIEKLIERVRNHTSNVFDNQSIIDRKFRFIAFRSGDPNVYSERNAILFCAKDRAVIWGLKAYRLYYKASDTVKRSFIEWIDRLIHNVELYQKNIESKIPDTNEEELKRCLANNLQH